MNFEALLFKNDKTTENLMEPPDAIAENLIEFPSNKHPDHPFKIGHFTDTKKISMFLKTTCGTTLPSIFGAPENTFSICWRRFLRPPVDWPKAKERLLEARNKFNERVGHSEKMLFFQKVFDVVEETIDYVLAHAGDGKEYRLSWRGEPEEWKEFK